MGEGERLHVNNRAVHVSLVKEIKKTKHNKRTWIEAGQMHDIPPEVAPPTV